MIYILLHIVILSLNGKLLRLYRFFAKICRLFDKNSPLAKNQVNVIKTSAFGIFLNMVNGLSIQKKSGKSEQRTSANARATEIFDISVLVRVDAGASRAETCDKRSVKSGKIKSA